MLNVSDVYFISLIWSINTFTVLILITKRNHCNHTSEELALHSFWMHIWHRNQYQRKNICWRTIKKTLLLCVIDSELF